MRVTRSTSRQGPRQTPCRKSRSGWTKQKCRSDAVRRKIHDHEARPVPADPIFRDGQAKNGSYHRQVPTAGSNRMNRRNGPLRQHDTQRSSVRSPEGIGRSERAGLRSSIPPTVAEQAIPRNRSKRRRNSKGVIFSDNASFCSGNLRSTGRLPESAAPRLRLRSPPRRNVHRPR